MITSGIEAMLEMLAGCGVRYLFGNPGTTELPLSDALVADRRLQYILALQECPSWPSPTDTPRRRDGRAWSTCTSAAAWETRWGCSTTPSARARPWW